MPAPSSGGILQAAAFATAGSWSTGAVPTGTSDNDVMVPGQLNEDVIAGATDYGAVPTDLDVLTIDAGFSRSFCSSGAPLKISAKLLRVYGSSGFFFEGDDDGVTGLPIDDVIINTRSPGTPVELGTASGAHADQDYEDSIIIQQGNVTFKSNMVLDAGCEVYLDGSGATLNVSDGMANPVVLLVVNDGLVNSHGEITTCYLNGGRLIQDTSLLTTIVVGNGAYFAMNHTSCTNIVVMRGGTVDFTMVSRDFKDVTNLTLHKGANAVGQFAQGAFGASPVAVTNLFDFRNDP